MRNSKKFFSVVLVNILILIFLLLLGEVGLRLINSNYQLYKRTYPNEYKNHIINEDYVHVVWPRKDSLLGWVCNNRHALKFSNRELNKLNIQYQINNEGFRNDFDFENQSNQNVKERILLLGDSFAFGVYLSENQTIISDLKNIGNGNLDFVNLGIPGYGIDQMFISYGRFQNLLKPNVVIVLYIDEDILRVYEAYRKGEGMNKPSFELTDDTLSLRTNDKPNIIEWIFQNSFLLNRFYHRYSEYESKNICEKIFSSLIEKTKLNNQKLLVVRCPVKEYFANGEQIDRYSFGDYFKNKSVRYIELFDSLYTKHIDDYDELYFKGDQHLTVYGARIVSKILEKIITNTMKDD